MSCESTHFFCLPNEIIYTIFDYLSSVEIIRSFSKINQRYDELIQYYVRQIDLTNGWFDNQKQFQWISKTIQTLRIDQYHLDLLTDSTLYSQQKKNHQKSSLQSILRKVFSCTQNVSRPSLNLPTIQFPQLHSLHLINIQNWETLIKPLHLNKFYLEFDRETSYFAQDGIIPSTITHFSTDIIFETNYFHSNLLHLNICVRSIVHLLDIISHTPNIESLSVTFMNYFSEHYLKEKYQLIHLTNLKSLSFTARYHGAINNDTIPFSQIRHFIDEKCPKETVLKKISLKYTRIEFDEDLWSTMIQYKQIYSHFHFYLSFRVGNHFSSIQEKLFSTKEFNYHIEGFDLLHPYGCFIHIYSIPFHFDTFYGYSSCSTLNNQCSFSNIHHLYTTNLIQEYDLISFEFLAKRMPNLVSIDCYISFLHYRNTDDSKVIIGNDMFNSVRYLCFELDCQCLNCSYTNILSRLIDRMPYLQCLKISEKDFHHLKTPVKSIKRLVLRGYHFELLYSLPERVPNLSILLLRQMKRSMQPLADHIGSLFIDLPYLTIISIKILSIYCSAPIFNKKTALEVLTHLQNMNQRFQYLKLTIENGNFDFILRNA